MGDGRLVRQGRQRRAVRSLPSLLIGPHELRLRKHVPFQSIQKLGFGRMVETGQYGVDCIELVKISMRADRWARAAVAGAFPVIEPMQRSAAPSGRLCASAGMFWMTQCTHVIFGARGSGASGSSTMSAKVFVPCGAADQLSGGEISAPSQVYCFGMAPLLANAGDVRTSAMARVSTPHRLYASRDFGKPSRLAKLRR